MIPLSVQGHTISAQNLEPLISGEVNSHLLRFTFSPEWEGLLKTAVFTNGETTVDVPAASWEDGGCAIPYEVLEKPWLFVSVGVEGRRGTQLVLRTTPLRLGHVSPSLSPCGHGAQELTPPVWQVILDCIGDPEELETENREDLVSAINELAAGGCGAPEVQLGGEAPGSGIKLWVDESAQWPQPDWTQDDSSEPDFIKNKPSLFSGSYDDLSDKPAIPAAQIQSDWNQTNTAALDYIKNKPVIPTGGMRKVLQFELEEAAEQIILDRDSNGNPFELSQYQIAIKYPGTATEAYNAFVYWIQGDTSGFAAQGNKAPVVNDSTAANLMVINGSFDRICFNIWERYGSIDKTDGRIFTNKKCTFVHMYTYTAGMVFPVGTYVELWGA